MGVLDTYNNSNFGKSSGIGGGGGGGGNFGYGSIGQVVDAYNQNKINYREAYTILREQFGLSDNDINDVLIAENKPPQPPPGTPDDSEDEEEIPDTSTDTTDTDTESIGLTDDQRFMLIGLVVLGAILGFIKK